MKKYLLCFVTLCLLCGTALADTSDSSSDKQQSEQVVKQSERIDRSKRTNPNPAAPSYAVGSANEASRYRTDQGWSRGRHYWWSRRSNSDIPTSGYTSPRGSR